MSPTNKWIPKFLKEVMTLKNRNVVIKSLILSMQANSVFINTPSLKTHVVSGYVDAVRLAGVDVPVVVNGGLREPIIKIVFLDKSGVIMSVTVHEKY